MKLMDRNNYSNNLTSWKTVTQSFQVSTSRHPGVSHDLTPCPPQGNIGDSPTGPWRPLPPGPVHVTHSTLDAAVHSASTHSGGAGKRTQLLLCDKGSVLHHGRFAHWPRSLSATTPTASNSGERPSERARKVTGLS